MSDSPTPPSAAAFHSADLLLSAIVDSSDDAIVSKNLNGIITSWNKGAERLFGYPAEEIIGKSVTILIPSERADEEPHIIERLKRGERVEHFDTQRVTKQGQMVEVSLTISPIRNKEGLIVGASKIARDISAKRRVEESVRTKTRNLEILNQLGLTLAAELDVEKLVQRVTDAGRELSGAAFGAFFYNVTNHGGESYMLYTLSGAPREAFEKFGMPRNTPIFAPTFAGEGIVRSDDILADPRYGKMSPHHGMPKGHLPVRSYLAVPVVARDGEVIGGLFFGHPEVAKFSEESELSLAAIAAQASVAIENARLYSKLELELHQHKLMENALRESEELSSAVLKSSADCIQVLDLEGNLQTMNPPGLSLFEIDNFEVLRGKSWVSLWPQEMHETIANATKVAQLGGVGRFQGPCKTAAGNLKWWDVIVTALRNAEGKVVRLTSTSRDITELKRAEDEIRVAQEEAMRQGRMKDEFLATLSHELRTPLQSIMGWAQILRSGDSEPGELAEGLEIIDRNAQAQNRIIEDLLDMNRILSGKVRLDVQRFQLASVIEAALETVRPAAQAKNIRLRAVLDPLAQPVSGDPSRLQQVFWNLLSNAIKFTANGGQVQVLLERVNSHLEVCVTDTGIGIEADFLPHVFERFRQADASITRNQGGLGLGLAIVKHLTELHGGSVRVKSAGPGKGTTFIVVLPLALFVPETEERLREHPAVSKSSAPLIDVPQLDGVKVLVVDDEDDARHLAGVILTKAGAVVQTAGSVEDVMARWSSWIPDVLISDIGMPGQDGYSLIRHIRGLVAEEGGRVPAIALSAYTRKEDRIRAITEGFQMHLSKPADALELLTMVQSLAKGKEQEVNG